jgi:uncharacterized membrane protein
LNLILRSNWRVRQWGLAHETLFAGLLLGTLSAVLFALGLNAHEIGRDESVSVLVARRSVSEMLALLATHEPHPAGYFLMLHFWPHDSVIAGRLLSFVPAVLVAPLMFMTARRLSTPPLTAGLLAATSPFLAYYAAETRNYAWLVLFGAAALALTAEVIAGAGTARIRLGLAAGAVLAAGLYIHYFALFTCVAVILVMVLWAQRRAALVAATTAVVLFAPGAVMLASQVAATGHLTSTSWHSRVDLNGVFVTFSSLFAGTGDYVPGLLLAAVFIAITLLAFRRAGTRTTQLLIVFLVLGTATPLLAGVFIKLVTPRYLAASLPALLLLCVAGLATLPRVVSRLATAGLLLASAVLIVSAIGRFDGQKLQIREALALAQSQHALPAIQGRMFATAAAYYSPGHVAYAFAPPPADYLGLWALPPGATFPPPDRGRVAIFDYCSQPPTRLEGYVPGTRTNFGGNLCVDLSEPAVGP